MLDLICAYCAHKLIEGALHCVHCGAPARAAAPVKALPAKESPVAEAPAAKSARAEPKSGDSSESDDLWGSVVPTLLVIFAVVVVALVVARHMSPGGAAAPTNPVAALPEPLRTVATCRPHSGAEGSEFCVIPAASSLLQGRLANNRDLTFYAQLLPKDQLTALVQRWRAEGSTIITDGPVFTAIGPSTNVLHANSTTGLRIDTATLTTPDSARTFLLRAGLARQPL